MNTAKFRLKINFLGACSVSDFSEIFNFFNWQLSIDSFCNPTKFHCHQIKLTRLREKYVDFQKMLLEPCLNIEEDTAR